MIEKREADPRKKAIIRIVAKLYRCEHTCSHKPLYIAPRFVHDSENIEVCAAVDDGSHLINRNDMNYRISEVRINTVSW